MATTIHNSSFRAGLLAGAPFVLVVVPFGMLFGVLATEAGLSIAETMIFAVTVFAGASQFTALQLMQEQAPTLIVLASSLAVNLRLAMYSASLTPWLGTASLWQRALVAFFLVDQSYAVAHLHYEANPRLSMGGRLAFYTGASVLMAPVWAVSTWAGAALGAAIPESWALDFALPITFLAMIAPMLRTPAHVAAALTGALVSIPGSVLPWNLGLLVAGTLGMIAGAETERRLAIREHGP